MIPNTLLPTDLQDRLGTCYANAVLAVATDRGIPLDSIELSARELALALAECQKDLDILVYRRSGLVGGAHEDFDGISIGKLAGTLIFRLSRYRIVHVSEAAVASLPDPVPRIASKLQEVAAFRFVCQDILKIRPPRSHPEMLYLLSRRHLNQEMLGLTLDVFCEHCTRLATRTPLDREPFSRLYKRP